MAEPGFTKVLCADERVVSFGPRQRDWLLAQGHARRIVIDNEDKTGEVVVAGVLGASEYTASQLSVLVMSEPSMRECDFCSYHPAPYNIACREFELRVGPNQGAAMGGAARPVCCCEQCRAMVLEGDSAKMLDYLCDRMYHYGVVHHLIGPDVSPADVRAHVGPQLRDTVNGIFHNMTAAPEEC